MAQFIQLVNNMKTHGVLNDPRVEEALLTIPRDMFVPEGTSRYIGAHCVDLKREACVDSPLRLAKLGFNVS